MALVTSINMAGGACKCGVGSLVHRRKFDRSHSDAAVLCAAALVFPSLGQDLCNNQTNAGYPEGFGMVERSSLSFCCRELICDSEVRASRACPSKPPDKSQSITCKILEIRSQAFYKVDLQTTNKKIEQMQCHSRGLVNSVQQFSTSYEGTHACTHAILGLSLTSSNTWHKRMPHDSLFLSVGHSVARKSRQR